MELHPASVHIGAEVTGVDLARPLSDDERRAVWDALLRWKVLFFRDQDLDHTTHASAAARFGTLTPAHIVFGGENDHPAVYSIAKHRTANSGHGEPLHRSWTGWHTDITAAVNPPGQSMLRADVIPPYGGDTQWTDLMAAYRALSEPMKAFVDSLRGIHRYAPFSSGDSGLSETGASEAGVDGVSADYRDRVADRTMVTEHPLVRVHPETGEKALYVSPGFLQSIVGLARRESQVMLEMLWEHVVRPEFTVRFRWDAHSVAFWDNRSTAHLAPADVFDTDFDRQLWRVTLMGEIPVGPDGRASTPIEGRPIAPLPEVG